jgi:hypothetical protein
MEIKTVSINLKKEEISSFRTSLINVSNIVDFKESDLGIIKEDDEMDITEEENLSSIRRNLTDIINLEEDVEIFNFKNESENNIELEEDINCNKQQIGVNPFLLKVKQLEEIIHIRLKKSKDIVKSCVDKLYPFIRTLKNISYEEIYKKILIQKNNILMTTFLGISIYLIHKTPDNYRFVILGLSVLICGIILIYLLNIYYKSYYDRLMKEASSCYNAMINQLKEKKSNGDVNPMVNKQIFIKYYCEKNNVEKIFFEIISKKISELAMNDGNIIERVIYIDGQYQTIIKLNSIIII